MAMDSVNTFFKRLGFLARRERYNRELDEELSFHRQQLEKDLRADGMDAEEARYAARRRFGNELRLKEQSHDVIGFTIEGVIQDIRYAFRQLRKNPGFATTAVVILALGIGAITAIFSAVNPILFKTLPYPQANRIMTLWEQHSDGSPLFVTFATFHGLDERTRSFDALAAMKPWQPTMVGNDRPERFEGQRVSANYFRALGVSPTLGREFDAADDRHKGPNVVVLSDKLWRRRFGSDRSIVGRQVTLNGDLFDVIGAMPASFENVLAPSAELWAPLQYDPSLPPDSREWGHHLRMVGRLRPGASKEQANGEVNVVLHALGRMYAKGYNESGGVPSGILVNSLQSDVTHNVKPALLAVLGAVGLVLLIACVNVANLLLARGAQRRGEFAMRAALGASRRRLTRQLITESLLLALIGGALGIAIAELGVRALVALSPQGLPRVNAITVDGAVFGFALGITTLIGLAVGMVPALQTNRRELHLALHKSARVTAGGHQAMRQTLVVSEVALALVLLVSAGLLLRSLHRLFAVDPGFDGSHLLTMQVQESGHYYDSDANRLLFFKNALETVRAVPGVVSADFTAQLPLSGDYEVYGVQFESDSVGEEGGFRYAVTPGYVETMRIPLRRGRLLNERDGAGAPTAVLISELFAKRKFGGKDPIGQRVRLGPDVGHAEKPWATIVGVVGDVKQESLALAAEDAFYVPTAQWPWADDVLSLVVRTRGDAAALAPSVRNAIWSVDKDQPIVRVATMESLLAVSEAQRHFTLIVLEAFALVGLVLAATGIYGVLSGSVSERTRELGIRAALGASRRDILALVLKQGMTLTGLGVLLGLAGAALASQGLVTLLFGVTRLDPITYLGVIALLLAVAGIACLVPASRAARVDPAITLRAE
jgi:putative ABC transport system permease protein